MPAAIKIKAFSGFGLKLDACCYHPIFFPLPSPIFASLVMGCLAEWVNYLILLKERLRLYPWCSCHIELVEI
jgi:hypothetical protein